MPNMGKIIKMHNSRLINNSKQKQPTCNCQRKTECPLKGKCMAENVVYSARITIDEPNGNTNNVTTGERNITRAQRRRDAANSPQTNPSNNPSEHNDRIPSSYALNQQNASQTQNPPKKEMLYIGAAENFKLRYRNHIKSFRHEIYQKETELSKYVWMLKNQNLKYSITWNILKQTSGYNKTSKICNLCISEKLEICKYRDKNLLLNKRNELISKCRHENKHLLANLPDP